jgi:hypothetical protein
MWLIFSSFAQASLPSPGRTDFFVSRPGEIAIRLGEWIFNRLAWASLPSPGRVIKFPILFFYFLCFFS